MAVRDSFAKASLPLKVFAVFATVLVVALTSPFWIPLLVCTFVRYPRRVWKMLSEKDTWRPFGSRR